jgi:hypothetical protein
MLTRSLGDILAANADLQPKQTQIRSVGPATVPSHGGVPTDNLLIGFAVDCQHNVCKCVGHDPRRRTLDPYSGRP